MQTALKEWAVVDEALGSGDQIVLLRKGGIHEAEGRFEIEHGVFLLYPTYLHQAPELLKPPFRAGCKDGRSDKGRVTIRHFARVIQSAPAPPTPETADRWDRFHIFSPELIEKRYAYKPERPLWLVIVRVFRLSAPTTVVETPQYAGCRSWVTLDDPVDIGDAVPVLENAAFDAQAAQLRQVLQA